MFQQTFKNFAVDFNGLNERNTVSAGDLLTGRISFDLTKETKISAMTLKLTGKASVHWSTGGKRKRHFSAKTEFFNFKTVIMQQSGAVRAPVKLKPGTHVYEFTCQLPNGDFPCSFRGVLGQIVYNMIVSISRPWHLSKDFVTQLNYVHHIDTTPPELRAPLEGSSSVDLCYLCCPTGPISMTARSEKKAFIPGSVMS